MKRAKQRTKQKPQAKPDPMVFEHVPVERPYDRIARRVLAAVTEINDALKEAHECAEMRVFIGRFKKDFEAMCFVPQIYSLTHSTLIYRIEVSEDPSGKMAWRHAKDPAFEDAAGKFLDRQRPKDRASK